MVKYRLVRPDVKKAERHEEREAESSHSTKRRIRGPISLYKDTVESYRAKKESVSNYYQNMVDEQKTYYDHGDDWQIQEQYKRDREFIKKLLKYGLVVALFKSLSLDWNSCSAYLADYVSIGSYLDGRRS